MGNQRPIQSFLICTLSFQYTSALAQQDQDM